MGKGRRDGDNDKSVSYASATPDISSPGVGVSSALTDSALQGLGSFIRSICTWPEALLRKGIPGNGHSAPAGAPHGAFYEQDTAHDGGSLSSRLVLSKVMHARLAPVRHEFTYQNPCFDIDLAELPRLNSELKLFGYNRFRLFSIYDTDHLPMTQPPVLHTVAGHAEVNSIDAKLRELIRRFGHDDSDIERIRLITAPPFLRAGFNPVSFFLCFDSAAQLTRVVSEVNNTFGETHLYITEDLRGAPGLERGGRMQSARFTAKKVFHVSPFNTREGDYQFYVSHSADEIDIRVDIARDNGTFFVSRLWGKTIPLTDGNLRRFSTLYPRTTTVAAARISWQAAKLYFGKGMRVYTKPIAASAQTIRETGPGVLQHFCQKQLHSFLGRIQRGSLVLSFPDGSTLRFGRPSNRFDGGEASPAGEGSPVVAPKERSREPRIQVDNLDFYTKTFLGGDVGFGEAYTSGMWRSDDLVGVLRTFVDNQETLDDRVIAITHLRRGLNRLYHLTRRNTRATSRSNIFAHYDLGNEFFATFLDPSMTYSCAYFPEPHSTLEEAQRAKIAKVIEKAALKPTDHVLEIGCGWGSFAIEAVKRTGCRVTGVTISEQQYALAMQRIRSEGLTDRITLKIQDYRDIQGSFDKIVSLEMLEAVGHEYLGRYFSTLDRLLAPNGIAVLQVITVPDQRYDAYRRGCDWIQRYVFPGGLCPSLTAICTAMTKRSTLFVQGAEDIGAHYARTLREWRLRFTESLPEVRGMGFDEEFIRTWEYYLSYCEAGFAGRLLGTLQLVLSRPNNGNLPDAPGY